MLPRLRQFWDTFQTKLANKIPYAASIGEMRLKVAELQESDEEARNFRAESLNSWEEFNRVLHHQGLPFVPEII